MKWTKHRKPNNKIPYDHVLLESPLGLISIEWKSWKDAPDYGVSIDNNSLGLSGYIGTEYSLEKGKDLAVNFLKDIHEDLKKFLK